MLKSVALYVVLVGIPLAGLFALLDWGAQIVPPRPIYGQWTLVEPTEAACPGLPAASVITIQQSGRFLQVRVGDMPAAEGHFDDDVITASVPAVLVGCSGGALQLEAKLDESGSRLAGSLGLSGCSACPPTALVAEKLPSKE